MYKDPITGAIPSAANQVKCITNKAVAQCYGVAIDISKLVMSSDTSIMDAMYVIYPTKTCKCFSLS